VQTPTNSTQNFNDLPSEGQEDDGILLAETRKLQLLWNGNALSAFMVIRSDQMVRWAHSELGLIMARQQGK